MIIVVAALAMSVLVAVLTHGHVLFLGLPVIIGLPLAGSLDAGDASRADRARRYWTGRMTRSVFQLGSRAQSAHGVAGVVLSGGALLTVAALNGLVGRRAERRHPPLGRFVDVEGVRLHYLERGAGPPIVLIHGNMVSASDFVISGLMELLAQDHRVIALDRPGFGHTSRPRSRTWTAHAQARLIDSALQKLNVVDPVVVGHSYGSLVALNIALDKPEQTAGLVLISGYYHPTPRPDVPLAGAAAVPVLGDLLRYTISPFVGRLTLPLVVRAMFSPARVTKRFHEMYASSMALRPSTLHAAGADALNLVPDAAKAGGHRRVRTPTLVIGGRQDRIVSFRSQSERFAREHSGSELVGVQGAGHMVHHSATSEVYEAVSAFLKTLPLKSL